MILSIYRDIESEVSYMTFSDRLKEARLAKGYTQEQIAEKIGVAKSTYTGYEKGNREPNVNTIGKLMSELHVDANFLWQDGTTFPFELSYDEMENLVKKYRELDDHGKEMVDFVLNKEIERIKSYGKITNEPNKVRNYEKRLISYYFKNASAGTGQIIIDNLPEKDIEIPDIPKYRCVSYAIGVNGSSMEPTFHDGDILLVEATREIEVGEIGIFQINDQCYVKELGETELISLNKDYENIKLDETAITLGKVIDKLQF